MEKRGIMVFILVMILLLGGLYIVCEKSTIQGRAVITGEAVGVEKEIGEWNIYFEEIVAPAIEHPDIAVDKNNQPHIVVKNGGASFVFASKYAGNWASKTIDASMYAKGGSYSLPSIAIDKIDDKGYIGGFTVKGGDYSTVGSYFHGISGISQSNLITKSMHEDIAGDYAPGGAWDSGTRVLVDPEKPGEMLIFVSGGWWRRYAFDNSFSLIDKGQVLGGGGGEKYYHAVSSSGGVKHVVNNIGLPYGSASYQNSRMQQRGQDKVVWSDAHYYPQQIAEGAYPSVCVDNEDPEKAYIFSSYQAVTGPRLGIVANIWDENNFIFSPQGGLLRVDSEGYTGVANREIARFPLKCASALERGIFVCYTGEDNRIKIRYINPDGEMSEIIDVGPGRQCGIATDSTGTIHIGYINGGLRYRKIENPYSCQPGETRYLNTPCYNDKMWDESGNWKINSVGNCKYGTKYQLCGSNGWEWTECDNKGVGEIEEKCNGQDDDCDGMIDEGCDDDQDGYIDGTMACGGLFYEQYGWKKAIPVSGDLDNDGIDDYIVYCGNCQDNLDWWIRYSSNNSYKQKDFGFANAIPVIGDYDGDGKEDLAVYKGDNEKGIDWYIQYSSTGNTVQKDFGWGGVIPVSLDYDNDNIDDLAVFCPSNCGEDAGGTWYIQQSRDGFVKKQFGWPGVIPVPGDYDGDGKDDLAVYCGDCLSGEDAGKDWWILESSTNNLVKKDFGTKGYEPVPGDYDGDGKTDLGVRIPEDSIWIIMYDEDRIDIQCRSEEGILNDNCHGCKERDLNDNTAEITTSYPCTQDSDCADDNNVCTDNKCVNNLCVYEANTNTCNDGLFCTINDKCSNKTCSGISKICSDDDLACTIPYCDETQDKCLFSFEECTCNNDGDCPDDENICTDIRCVNKICEQIENTNFCDDNDLCTDNDVCTNGLCIGVQKNIDDGDPTTYDSCVDGVVKHEEFEAGRLYDFEYEYEELYGIIEDMGVGNQSQQIDKKKKEIKINCIYVWVVVLILVVIGVIYYIKKKGMSFRVRSPIQTLPAKKS